MAMSTNVKISHIKQQQEMMQIALTDMRHADVTFLVEGRQFKAHRIILALRSPVYEAMLFNDAFKETNDPKRHINLPDKRADVFSVFLNYIYTFSITGELDLDTIIELSFMAHEYQLSELVSSLCETLKTIPQNFETISKIYELAVLIQDEALLEHCRAHLCHHAVDYMESNHFCQLSKAGVDDLISNNALDAPEINVLLAIARWKENNEREDVTTLLEKVRYNYLTTPDARIDKVIKAMNELGNDMTTIIEISAANRWPPREIPQAFLGTENIILKRIDDGRCGAPCILILRQTYIIDSLFYEMPNHIDRDRQYSVSVSVDGVSWQLIADCINKPESCDKVMVFRPVKAKLIKIDRYWPAACEPQPPVKNAYCPAAVKWWSREEICSRYSRLCPNGETLILDMNVSGIEKYAVLKSLVP